MNDTYGFNNITEPSATEDGVIYWINNSPITVSYLTINIFALAIQILIIALNSLMIEALRRSDKVNEPAGHCLITLSASYIWLSVMIIYTAIYGLVNMQDKNECLIRFGLVHSAYMNMAWANVLLSIERLLQVEIPMFYTRVVTIKGIWISNACCMLTILFFCLSPVMFDWYRPMSLDGRINVCQYFNILPAAYIQVFSYLTFLGVVIIGIIYARLLVIARRHRNAIQQLQTLANSFPAQKCKRWQGIKMGVTISGIFLMLWAPPGIFGLYISSNPSYPKSNDTRYVTALLSLIPSIGGIVNPCLFALNKQVKAHFLSIIRMKKAVTKLRARTWRKSLPDIEQTTIPNSDCKNETTQSNNTSLSGP